MNEAEREDYITLLITKHDFNRADRARESYLNMRTDEEALHYGINRSHQHKQYWMRKFVGQSKESRENFKKYVFIRIR